MSTSSDAVGNTMDISDSIQAEEDKLRKTREHAESVEIKRMAEERQKDINAGSEEINKKHKALQHLLNQSKVAILIALKSN
jgi:hypothetical protein